MALSREDLGFLHWTPRPLFAAAQPIFLWWSGCLAHSPLKEGSKTHWAIVVPTTDLKDRHGTAARRASANRSRAGCCGQATLIRQHAGWPAGYKPAAAIEVYRTAYPAILKASERFEADRDGAWPSGCSR